MNIAICDDEQIYADEIKKHVECYFTRREVPHKIYVFTEYMCSPTGKRLLGAK